MAVTGIITGYNMYMDPYYGAPAKTAGTAAAPTAGAAKSVPVAEGGAAGTILAGNGSTAGSFVPGVAADGMPLRAGIPWAAGKAGDTKGMPLPFGREAKGGVSPAKAADPDAQKKAGRKSSPEECQTCKERKYQDGSDENVSFKSAAHISPEAAGAAVRAHEGEHVSNAYKEAAENGGEVVNASVTIHTAICPECGRTYVSGGTTSTTIRYSQEKNPYKKAKEAQEAIRRRGNNIDYAA